MHWVIPKLLLISKPNDELIKSFKKSLTVFLALIVGDSQSLLNVQFVTQWHQVDMDCPNQHLHIRVLPERVLLLQRSRSL